MTSPSQADGFDESHDEGDDLADESCQCEVPTPKQDGVEDLAVVWATPPRIVEEGDGEENDDRPEHEACEIARFEKFR